MSMRALVNDLPQGAGRRRPDGQGLPHLARDGHRRRRAGGTPESGDSATSRKRAIRAAVVEVSHYLGNTPTMARSSYIDPRVIDLYEDGVTIGVRRTSELPLACRTAGALERAVLRMLSHTPESAGRAKRSGASTS